MNRKLFITLPLALIAVLAMTITTRANLLSNPGFETGNLAGWTMGGSNGGSGVLSDGQSIPGVTHSGFLPSYQNVRSGNYGAYAVTAGTNGEYVSFAQTLSLAPGNYTASF